MKKILQIALSMSLAVLAGGAASFEEDFSSPPASSDWRVFGDTNLFQWAPEQQHLEVIWDSSKANSYYLHPLGTLVTKRDDFGFEFDLRLDDVAVGVSEDKPFNFELALGLTRLASATNATLRRGVGQAAQGPRNLVEFDYFPRSGIVEPTISPTIVSSNNLFASEFSYPLELDPGAWFHVAMNYTASNQTLRTTMTRNGEPFGPIRSVALDSTFTDFRVDHFAISSYSDAGAGGSILARGAVDDVRLTLPDPPVAGLTGAFSNGVWQATFISRSHWIYRLERTLDFSEWTGVSTTAEGNDGLLSLADPNAPSESALYRVRAERP